MRKLSWNILLSFFHVGETVKLGSCCQNQFFQLVKPSKTADPANRRYSSASRGLLLSRSQSSSQTSQRSVQHGLTCNCYMTDRVCNVCLSRYTFAHTHTCSFPSSISFNFLFINEDSHRWLPEQELLDSEHQRSSQSAPTKEQVSNATLVLLPVISISFS